jgi:hypothetical protein
MKKMKYIIGGGLDTAVVFDELLNHVDVARSLFGIENVTAAGFCFMEGSRWLVYGESVSLRIKAQPKDEATLNRSLLGVYNE